MLQFSGALTKALISEIVVKIGSRVVFGPISGAQLDKLNQYRGMSAHANFLTIDLTERDGLSIVAKEVGAIDLPSLGGEQVFVEVVNTASTGTPTLIAYAGYTGVQYVKDGKNDTQEQLIHKVLKYSIPTAGGTRVSWQPNFGGALIKRVHFEYAGTDWTASANGNLYRIETRRNGYPVWDRVEDLTNRFILAEQQKVPQSRWYSLDFIHDNTQSSMLDTKGVRSLECILDFTAADTLTAFVEVLDLPRNL